MTGIIHFETRHVSSLVCLVQFFLFDHVNECICKALFIPRILVTSNAIQTMDTTGVSGNTNPMSSRYLLHFARLKSWRKTSLAYRTQRENSCFVFCDQFPKLTWEN